MVRVYLLPMESFYQIWSVCYRRNRFLLCYNAYIQVGESYAMRSSILRIDAVPLCRCLMGSFCRSDLCIHQRMSILRRNTYNLSNCLLETDCHCWVQENYSDSSSDRLSPPRIPTLKSFQ